MFMLVIDTNALYAMTEWHDRNKADSMGFLRAILDGRARIVLPRVMLVEMDGHNHNGHSCAKIARATWIRDDSMLKRANREEYFRQRMSLGSKGKLDFVEHQPVQSDDKILEDNPRADNDGRVILYAKELMTQFGEHRVGVLTDDISMLDLCYDHKVPRWSMSKPRTLTTKKEWPGFIDLLLDKTNDTSTCESVFKKLGRERL